MGRRGLKPMRVTIEDVAKLAGVSRQTVSRVLNNHQNVKPETRARVQDIIERVRYYPNVAAQNLSRNTVRTIGFYTPFTTDNVSKVPFYSEIFLVISKICLDNDFQFQIFTGDEEDGAEECLIQAYRERKVSGVLVACPSVTEKGLVSMENEGIPFVVIGRPSVDLGFCFVDHNNLEIGYLGTKHLIDCGCHRIAFINGPSFMTYSQDLHHGYRKALVESGIPYSVELVREGDLTQASGYENMKHLLSTNVPFDGVFVVNDMMTIGVFEAIRQQGRLIPDDIMLFAGSINGIEWFTPSISGFANDIYTLGELATQMLIERIVEGTVGAKKRIVSAEFRLGSTAIRKAL